LGDSLKSLDLPTFAFLDKKNRPPKETAALAAANFDELCETAFAGMEQLLAAEVAVDKQWAFLDQLRIRGAAPNAGIPATRPADAAVQALTVNVLKDSKGWGRTSDLIELCNASELPESITGFLAKIYAKFPRPKIEPIPTEQQTPDAEPPSEPPIEPSAE